MTGTDDEVRENGRRPDPRVAGLTPEFVDEVRDALDRGQPERVRALVTPLGYADLADLLEPLDRRERAALIQAIHDSFDPTVLTELDDSVRLDVVEQFSTADLAAAIAKLESDDALYLIETLDDERRIAVMQAMPAAFRAILEQGLSYPESSAGRLMQRDVVAVPEYWTVGQTVDYLRAHPDLPDEFYDIFLIDPRFRVTGVVPLSRVLRSRRAVALLELKQKELRTFPAEADQEEVARAFQRYALFSAPVVGADGGLLGVITVDDVVDVIEEEAEDDILKLGGVSEDDTYVPILRTALRRLPWLAINLFTALLGAFVIAQFEATIAGLVALAALMPMVAGMGGNAGTQALTVTVRALATGEIAGAGAWRALRKELAVGALNGITFLVAGAALALVWLGEPVLAAVFGVALLINLIVAGLIGATVPMLLDRLGQDPAVASGVFLTTVTDVVGFFVFLGLASLFLL